MVATSKEIEARKKLSKLMFPRYPRLGAFFSFPPIRLGLFFSAGSILFLIIPALLAHVALIKDSLGHTWPWVGFWQRWNWAIMYLIILPLIFAGAAALSQFSLTIFSCLTDGKYAVVKKSDGSEAVDFADAIAIETSHKAQLIFWSALGIAIFLTVVDTHELAVGYYNYFTHRPYTFGDSDWSVAFALPPSRFLLYGFHQTSAAGNALFDLLAYSIQTATIFLGLFWIMIYWATLNAFSTRLVDTEIDFRFDPWWDDPECRMGLLEVGKLFNGFLAIATLFEIYVLGHRFQLIARAGIPLAQYAREIKDGAKNLQILWAHRAFDTCTPGMWLLLIFILLPIVVIAWVPLIRFRKYLRSVKKAKYKSLQEELKIYKFGTAERNAALDVWNKINTANVWPNGDFAGWSFLVFMFVLAGASWFPPFLAYLLAGGGFALLYKFLSGFASKGPKPSE
jgi:hypothetical protein